MNDYISRAAAIKEMSHMMNECLPEAIEELDAVITTLKEIPAADVVAVVRCRDCVYWRGENDICKGICIDFSADGYCSEGVRKDGGQDE